MIFDTLIQSDELLANLHLPDWLVLDVRHDLLRPEAGIEAWSSGHIPGSIHVSLDEVLSGVKSGSNGRHPLPDRDALAGFLASLGVGLKTQVVACDAHGGMFAARVWWLLRWLGHERVAVLDGGIPAWIGAGGEVDLDAPVPRPSGDLAAREPLCSTVSADDILPTLGTGDLLIVDARSPDRFRGENETMDPVGGHIPGAKNRFYRDNLLPDGRFKTAGDLRKEWEAVLQRPARRAVMQCGSGVTACHNLLALEIAGLEGASLYPGSWSEWCTNPLRPVAR